MDCDDIHFRSYVYTGFELGKSAIQLTEDLQELFGVDAAPCLRAVQLWIYGSFSIKKNVSSGRPQLVWIPQMTSKVDNLVAKWPRISCMDPESIHRILTMNL